MFSELGGIIQRLEDKIYTEKTDQPSIIHLDKNEKLKGLEHLDVLYQSIVKKMVLVISYRSFNSRSATDTIVHPYILKEYNNRWFLVGKKHATAQILTLALDRIEKVDYDLKVDYENEEFSADDYYKDTYGVTVLNDKSIKNIVLKIDKRLSLIHI